MHSQVLVLFSLLCVGWSHDITLGNTEGRKIFDEVRQATPAIWRQYENVTVIAPGNELIGKVVVTDMRPQKDGDVQIVNGGDGQKSVTIELKSPTVLRGYNFRIEVYSVPDTVATDAEEHLYNDGMAQTQSNESTELPDSASKDVTTEMPNDEVKEGPSAVAGDVDSVRPPRETEENKSLMDISEGLTTTISYETSSSSESGESVTADQDKTTEIPETLEVSTVSKVDHDIIRPARETVLDTSSTQPPTDSTESEVNIATTEAASEIPVTDASEGEVKDVTTTEATITTASDDHATFTPITYDNSKNIPNYPSLNILDYIKNRESLRPIRHTEDDKTEQKDTSPEPAVQPQENTYDTTTIVEETSSIRPGDETVDLLPPKIDAIYNTDFSGLETTEHPVEGSSSNNVPRAGRGVNFDSVATEEITPTSIYTESTPTPTTADVTTAIYDEDHTITPLDDQLRNTRGARKEHGDENEENISGEIPENPSLPNEAPEYVKQPNKNIIIVNLDELMPRDENNKFVYTLPIVLLINSENNYPIIKIIAEDASNVRDDNKGSNELYTTQTSDESLNPDEYDYNIMRSDRIKKGDYMPSGDSDGQ